MDKLMLIAVQSGGLTDSSRQWKTLARPRVGKRKDPGRLFLDAPVCGLGICAGATVESACQPPHGFLFQHHEEFAADVLSFLEEAQ